MKMKKENIVSEIIYKRIEEEGESKLQNERKIDNYKLTLNAITKIMNEYRPLAKEISHLFAKHKESISYNEYQFILRSITNFLKLASLKDLPLTAADIFQLLIGENQTKANSVIKSTHL